MVTDDVLARWLAIHQDELRSGEKVIVRKADRADIPLIYEYLTKLSDEDRRNRYFTSLPLELLQAQQRLERIYDRTLDHVHHEAYVVVGSDGKILGVVHAWETDNPGEYEVSYSRRSDRAGCGIGRILMECIIAWAKAHPARRLVAETLRENGRMRGLFERNGFTAGRGDDPTTIAFVCDLGAITT